MTKQRVSINGITRWKEVDATPKKAAPAVEEAKVVPLRQAIGEVLRDIRQRQGRTLREVSTSFHLVIPLIETRCLVMPCSPIA